MHRSPWLHGLAGLALSGAAGLARAEPAPITVHFHQRPPYMLAQADGSPTGLTGSVVKAAFEKAGLPVRWAVTPSSRQLLLIEGNAGRDCGIGWFRNPQREQFARFSHALYRDLPWAVLAGPSFPLPSGAGLQQILGSKELRLLVKDRYSYGPDIDARIAQFPGEVVSTTGDWSQILGMLARGRADFVFAAPEEIQHLLATDQAAAASLRLLSIADAPAGEFRYLMCSKQVSEAELAVFNAALSVATRPAR